MKFRARPQLKLPATSILNLIKCLPCSSSSLFSIAHNISHTFFFFNFHFSRRLWKTFFFYLPLDRASEKLKWDTETLTIDWKFSLVSFIFNLNGRRGHEISRKVFGGWSDNWSEGIDHVWKCDKDKVKLKSNEAQSRDMDEFRFFECTKIEFKLLYKRDIQWLSAHLWCLHVRSPLTIHSSIFNHSENDFFFILRLPVASTNRRRFQSYRRCLNLFYFTPMQYWPQSHMMMLLMRNRRWKKKVFEYYFSCFQSHDMSWWRMNEWESSWRKEKCVKVKKRSDECRVSVVNLQWNHSPYSETKQDKRL